MHCLAGGCTYNQFYVLYKKNPLNVIRNVLQIHRPGAVVSVLHVGHTDGGVADPVVDHRVHWYRHAVLGQNLQQSGVIFPCLEDDLSIMEMWERKNLFPEFETNRRFEWI